MSNNNTNFSAGLRRARKAAGFRTQQDFSDAFHKSLNAVQKWEQGKTKPTMDEFLDLCHFFNCDADYLLGNMEEKTHDLHFICDTTGLSSKAVAALIDLRKKSAVRAYSDLLSSIITDPDFEYFLGLLEGFFSAEKEYSAELSMSRFNFRQKDLAVFAAGNALQKIMERVESEFTKQYLSTEQRLELYTEEKMMKKRAGGASNG